MTTNRFKYFAQSGARDCGAACLRAIAYHYGKKIDHTYFEKEELTTLHGTNFYNLQKAAEKIGFNGTAFQLPFEKLTGIPLPAILHWDQNHFVVLYSIENKNGDIHLQISDPAVGKYACGKEDFLQHWAKANDSMQTEGLVLVMQPADRFTKKAIGNGSTNYQYLKNLFAYVKLERSLFLKMLLLLFLSNLLMLSLPILTQKLFDDAISPKSVKFLQLIIGAQLLVISCNLFFNLLYQKIVQLIAIRLNGRILSDFVSKLFRLPVTFYEKKTTGEIIQRVDDHYRIEQFLTGNAVNVLLSVCLFVFYSVILITYSYLFFLLNIAFTTAYFFWTKLFLQRRKILSNQQFTWHSKNDSHLIEVVQGMTEIKLNDGAKQKLNTWKSNLTNIFNIQLGFLKIRQAEQARTFILSDVKGLLLTFIAAYFVITNQLTVGKFMAIQLIIGQLSNPVDQFMYLIQEWQDAVMSFDRMEEIKAIPDEDNTDVNDRNLIYTNEKISINNLSFSYPGSETVSLQNINLTIEQNKLTAIVGSSGSGKSTLLKLLMKFYEPTAGNITVGANELAAFSHKEWRTACGSVLQDGFIFSDSIANNIALGADTPDTEKVLAACHIAAMNDFLNDLPLGLDTMLTEGGLNLSKGQRQRLLIARAIYKNPSILFFDEATNSLDTRTEAIITQNLQPFLKNKTVITVAHRLDTVINADNIIVLEKGLIVEQGTHKELISNKAAYYNLVKKQLQIGE